MQTSTIILSLAIALIAALALAPRGPASADDKPAAAFLDADPAAKHKHARHQHSRREHARRKDLKRKDLNRKALKRKDVNRLLELNGAKAAATDEIDPMVKSFESLPGMTPDMMESMKEEFEASLDALTEPSIEPCMQVRTHGARSDFVNRLHLPRNYDAPPIGTGCRSELRAVTAGLRRLDGARPERSRGPRFVGNPTHLEIGFGPGRLPGETPSASHPCRRRANPYGLSSTACGPSGQRGSAHRACGR